MCHCRGFVFIWIVLCLSLSRPALGGTISIGANGTTIDLGTITPNQPNIAPFSTQIAVRASAPYSLLAVAPNELKTSSREQTIPIDRLKWRLHSFAGSLTPFVGGNQVILGAQPPTPPEGRAVVLDLQLVPSAADPPTAADGSDPYRAQIEYVVTAGTIDHSYAWPNPFSPDDGDSVNRVTVIHWYQGVTRMVDVLVYDASGETLVRTLTIGRPLGIGE
ncbi:MAG: hypothetical protein V2A73_19045 [Pseudomonadota bacterium]